MKVAISNIAWPQPEEEAAAEMMQSLGVRGVEVAPTKVWPRPLEVAKADLNRYRSFWSGHGIAIVALQALLFGRPDLVIFGERTKRQETIDYLSGMMDVGAALGAKVLVFGSPVNRRAGALPREEVEEIALVFFHEVGRAAAERGVLLCIEPNPVEYGCDFITCAADALDLVKRVGSPGFGLHLDAGALTLSGESIHTVLDHGVSWVRHFHVSEPYLGQVGPAGADHRVFARALARAGYPGWVSIEMRAQEPYTLASVQTALRTALDAYGSASD